MTKVPVAVSLPGVITCSHVSHGKFLHELSFKYVYAVPCGCFQSIFSPSHRLKSEYFKGE